MDNQIFPLQLLRFTDLPRRYLVIQHSRVNLELKKDTVDKFGELFSDLGEGSETETSSTQSEFSFGSPSRE